MTKAKVAWKRHDKDPSAQEVRDGKAPDMIGFQEIECHVIFDVKMDFTRKARFVAGGHMTETPTAVTYSSVVSRDSVQIGFTIAALNGVDLLACEPLSYHVIAQWFNKSVYHTRDHEFTLTGLMTQLLLEPRVHSVGFRCTRVSIELMTSGCIHRY
jgi:hypothetical protein